MAQTTASIWNDCLICAGFARQRPHSTCGLPSGEVADEHLSSESALGRMVYGLWFIVFGLWFMVYGLWFKVYGLWCIVCGFWFVV